MDIVSKGKDQLREIGIAVASDFVERQRGVMKSQKARIVHAYYKGGKLFIGDDTDQRMTDQTAFETDAIVAIPATKEAAETNSSPNTVTQSGKNGGTGVYPRMLVQRITGEVTSFTPNRYNRE